MFVISNDDSQILSDKLISNIFDYLLINPIYSIAIELPIYNTQYNNNNKIDIQLSAIRNGLNKYLLSNNNILNKNLKILQQFFICTQSLHDLHCYCEYIGKWFPRNGSVSRVQCKYIPHCPCNMCQSKQYGLGKLYEKYKIHLHQKGIENDNCSGIDNKYLYLNNILNVGQITPINKPPPPPLPPIGIINTFTNINKNKNKKKKRHSGIIDISHESKPLKKRKIISDKSHVKEYIDMTKIDCDFDIKSNKNIFKCVGNNNDNNNNNNINNINNNNSHLLSLIGQQSQLDLHTKRLLMYQQFKKWKCISDNYTTNKNTNMNILNEENRSELQRLQTLRTMQYKQQIEFQKTKKDNTMIINKSYGVVGSKDHMNCIQLTPNIPFTNLIQYITPKREYYNPVIANINLNDIGFAQMAIQQMIKQNQQKLLLQQQQQQQLKKKKKKQQQQQQVNADNFTKIQNIIKMIVKNKMSFCGGKIRSTEHAIHHVTNCVKCMSTLERFKGTVFK